MSLLSLFRPSSVPDYAADTFTRGDDTDLGQTEVGGFVWLEAGQDSSIDTNQIAIGSGEGYATIDFQRTDGAVLADAISGEAYVIARYTDSSNMLIAGFNSGATDVRLWKRVSGTWTQVDIAAVGSYGGRVAMQVIADEVTVYVDDVLLITYSITDSILLDGTRFGVEMNNGLMDNFEVMLELELGDEGRSVFISLAEMESPSEREGRIGWAELEAPDAPRAVKVAYGQIQTGDPATEALISYVEVEFPDHLMGARVSLAEIEAPNAPRAARVSQAEFVEQAGDAREGYVVWRWSQGRSKRHTFSGRGGHFRGNPGRT